MKNILSIGLYFIILSVTSCKKSETKSEPTPEPEPVNVTRGLSIYFNSTTPNSKLDSVYFRTKCDNTYIDSTGVKNWYMYQNFGNLGDLCSHGAGTLNDVYLNVKNKSSYRFEICYKTSSINILGYIDFDSNNNHTGNSGVNAVHSTTVRASNNPACTRFAITK